MFTEAFIIGGAFFWFLILAWFVAAIYSLYDDTGTIVTVATIIAIGAIQGFSNFNILGYIWENLYLIPAGIGGYAIVGAIWYLIKWSLFNDNLIVQRDEEKERWLSIKGMKNTITQMEERIVVIDSDLKRKHFSDDKVGEIERQRLSNERAVLVKEIQVCSKVLENATTEQLVATPELRPAWDWYCSHNANRKLYHRVPYLVPPDLSHHANKFALWLCWWPISMLVTLLRDPIKHLLRWTHNKIKFLAIAIRDWRWRDVDDDFAAPGLVQIVPPKEEIG